MTRNTFALDRPSSQTVFRRDSQICYNRRRGKTFVDSPPGDAGRLRIVVNPPAPWLSWFRVVKGAVWNFVSARLVKRPYSMTTRRIVRSAGCRCPASRPANRPNRRPNRRGSRQGSRQGSRPVSLRRSDHLGNPPLGGPLQGSRHPGSLRRVSRPPGSNWR